MSLWGSCMELRRRAVLNLSKRFAKASAAKKLGEVLLKLATSRLHPQAFLMPLLCGPRLVLGGVVSKTMLLSPL